MTTPDPKNDTSGRLVNEPITSDRRNIGSQSHPSVQITTNSIGMKMSLIPAGTFTMGDSIAHLAGAHPVTLSNPFKMGIYAVTQAEYEQVMGRNPSQYKGATNPVERVRWDDAVDFCRQLNKLPEEELAGNHYRLPTEAEWEYACRAGTTTKFSFGDDASKLGDYAWFKENAGKNTHPVGRKKPNNWGLHDMHGNVWEWCHDWYGKYPIGPVTDPTGPVSGLRRVFRGGSERDAAVVLASAQRASYYPSGVSKHTGFRVCLTPIGK